MRRKITSTNAGRIPSGMVGTHSGAGSQRTCTIWALADKTIQAILRHANEAVTQNSYIKTLDSQSIAAMRQLESLVDVGLLSESSESRV